MKKYTLYTIAVLFLSASLLYGSEFRSFSPIATRMKQHKTATFQGIERIKNLASTKTKITQLALEKVRKAIPALANAWNGSSLESWLSDKFYDKTRFLDSMQLTKHTDAKLRILSVDSIRSIGTNIRKGSNKLIFETMIAANVRTQVEYNDAAAGFQRREGVSEFVFKVAHPVNFISGGNK